MSPLPPSRARLAAALAFVATSAPAALATDYFVSGSLNKNVGGSSSQIDYYEQGGPLPTGGEKRLDDFGPDQPSFHAQANSAADPSGLHAHAFSQIIKESHGDGAFDYNQSASAFAQVTWTDFVIHGPAGAPPIPVSFNVRLDGAFITEASFSASHGAYAGGTVQLVFFAKDDNLGGGSFSTSAHEGDLTTSGTGSLANFDGDDVIASPVFNAPVNTPFTVALQLTAFAGVQGFFDDSFLVAANTDFTNTAAFPTDRPVFNNLPAGYSVTSADAHITDNTFSIPEPGAAALALASLLPIRRRRRQPSHASR